MAKRIRDHKAEYAARKRRAQAAGFSSVRSYRKTRETLKLPRSTKLSMAVVRRANKKWSDEHSRLPSSRWSPDLSDEKQIEYYNAFTRYKHETRKSKMKALHKYLVGNGIITESEWSQNYRGPERLVETRL